jgi:hypothetical protein
MTGIVLTPISPPTIVAWQITPASAADLVIALNTVVPSGGYTGVVTCWEPEPNLVDWALTLTKPGYPQLDAAVYDWVVFDGTTARVLTTAQVVAAYTADVPLQWAPTATAPVATALGASQASIVFPQPTSANGPFTYSVEQTNTTADTTGPATILSDSVDDNGNTTIIVADLTDGDDYTFTVTVDTPYTDATATSLPSNPVTATTIAGS